MTIYPALAAKAT